MAVAIAVAQNKPHMWGDKQMFHGVVTFTGSYATGGDAYNPTSLLTQSGVGTIDIVLFDQTLGYGIVYDYTNHKILVYTTAETEFTAGAYSAGLLAAAPRAMIIGI